MDVWQLEPEDTQVAPRGPVTAQNESYRYVSIDEAVRRSPACPLRLRALGMVAFLSLKSCHFGGVG